MRIYFNTWYKVVYLNKEELIFKFLGTTEDGRSKFELQDGQITYSILDTTYLSIQKLTLTL